MNDKIRVLYAEDDPLTLLEVSEKLKQQGYEVIVAVNGREAFEKYREYLPDLVILDILMPEYDGFEVLQLIRLTDSVTPVVIYSSLAEEKKLLKGFELGANVYILKIYTVTLLIAAVHQILIEKGRRANARKIHLNEMVSFNQDDGELKIKNRIYYLRPLEQKIFALLCENRNKLVFRKKLIELGWKQDNGIQLNKMICLLRIKLAQDTGVSIETIKNCGYILKVKDVDR